MTNVFPTVLIYYLSLLQHPKYKLLGAFLKSARKSLANFNSLLAEVVSMAVAVVENVKVEFALGIDHLIAGGVVHI